MFRKYFYLIISLNIIIHMKCQSRDDEYDDYDPELQTKTGIEDDFSLFDEVYALSLKNHLSSCNDLNQHKLLLAVMQYSTVAHRRVQ